MTLIVVIDSTPPPLPVVRCPACHRRLFDGQLIGEIQCPKCGRLVKFSRAMA